MLVVHNDQRAHYLSVSHMLQKYIGLVHSWFESSNLIGPHEVINPRRACAARVTVLGLSVCLSVRPSVRLSLAVQGTGRPMTATNRFRVARSLILIGRFS